MDFCVVQKGALHRKDLELNCEERVKRKKKISVPVRRRGGGLREEPGR